MNEHTSHPPHGEESPSGTRFRRRFRRAAIEAELATGAREPTRSKAWQQAIRRMARLSLGIGVTGLGVVLLPLPGPGMLVVAVGLALLARDVAWADRLLQRVRRRLPADTDGKLPRSTVVTMTVIAAAGIAASIWLSVAGINPLDVILFWRS